MPATPVPNIQRGVFVPRVRYALVTAVLAALLLSLPAVATATGDHFKGIGKSRLVERLRQIEKQRLQALVDADVAVAGPLIASDFELINPLGDVLTRNDVLGGVGSGALDFLSGHSHLADQGAPAREHGGPALPAHDRHRSHPDRTPHPPGVDHRAV